MKNRSGCLAAPQDFNRPNAVAEDLFGLQRSDDSAVPGRHLVVVGQWQFAALCTRRPSHEGMRRMVAGSVKISIWLMLIVVVPQRAERAQ